MANTIFKDLTTRSAFTTSPNDKVVSLWIGDSIICGTSMAPTSDVIDPTSIYPNTLTTIAKYWNKLGTAGDGSTGRLVLDDNKAGGTSAGWEDVIKGGGSVSGNLQYVAPYYGTALYMAGSGAANFTANVNHASTTKHHTVVLGISGSAVNDDTTTVPTALAHWEPSVASGAFTLLTEHYIQPAFANLQTSSGVIYLDCVYIHIGNDASSTSPAFSQASAQKYDIHMRRLIAQIEKFLEFPGIPICIVQTPQLSSDFKWAGTIRAAQARIAAARPRTFLVNSNQYAQGTDHIHFRAMDNIKLGYDAAQLVRTRLPNQWANITKAF